MSPIYFPMRAAWDVLLLFLIPVGGGIPAGVIVANQRGLAWPSMMGLYFISDVILAFVFEGLILLFRWGGQRVAAINRFIEHFRKATQKTIARYGVMPGPFALIMISLGVDPMTGRSAALAAGHGFFSGWALAIAGDLIFFTILMVSTLFLNNVLGDGTWAAILVMVAMMVIPAVFRRVRGWRRG